jgi:hypothetical protein
MNKPSPTFSSSPAVSGDRCQRDFSQWPCFLMLLAALVLCLIPACSRQSETVTVLARVGERAITAEDLQKEVERRRQIRRPVPAKDILLQEMVAYESMLQRALSSGLDKDPKVKRDLNNLLIAKLKEKELMPLLDAVEVSEEEIAAAYEKQIDQYQHSSKVRLALLQLKANPKTNDAAREEMRKQLEMARHKFMENPPRGGRGPASGGFGALAIEYSEDQVSRYRGGDIGWLDADRFTYHWPRTVLATGYALEKG